MNNSVSPIGFFDSGIGGTSILKEVISILPNENTIYLSDSANAPYGQKTKEKILLFSKKNTEFLLEKKCKLIVVACNTATTMAIKALREQYRVPFIGIEPAIKPAALKTNTKVIGVLATKGTLSSELFEQTSNTINENISIVEQVGDGLVELIENGKMHSNQMTLLLQKYLQAILEKNADSIVLGCTHYSYLIPQIKNIVGNAIAIIDSGEAVARQTKNILVQNNLQNESDTEGKHQLFINTDSQVLKNLLLKAPFNYSIQEINF